MPQSFDNLEHWRSDFLQNANVEPDRAENFPFLVLGNKSDLEAERKVSITADVCQNICVYPYCAGLHGMQAYGLVIRFVAGAKREGAEVVQVEGCQGRQATLHRNKRLERFVFVSLEMVWLHKIGGGV